MKKDRLEEKLRGSLGEYPSPMDLEGAWSRLEQARSQKKRRGLLIWWLGIAGGSIGVFVFALLFPNNTLPGGSATVSELQHADTQEEEFSLLLREEGQTPPQSIGLTLSAQTTIVDALNNSPAYAQAVEQGFKISSSKNQIEKGEPAEKTAKESLENEILPSNSVASEVARQGVKIGRLIQLQTAMPKLIILENRKRLEFLPVAATGFRRSKNKGGEWWIGFSATIGLQQRNLTTNSSTSQDAGDLLTRRNATEKLMEAYSFSFDIRHDMGPHWYFQSGVRHQLSYEHFEDQYERTFDKVLEDQLTEIIQRADGTTSEIRGDVMVPVTESVNTSFYNTQNLTEIPVLVGYQQELTSKVSLDASLGFLYGLVQRKEGQVHASSTSIGSYQSLGQMPYRQSSLFGGQLQGAMNYKLSDRWQWYGGMQAKIYPNIVESNAEFSERQLMLNAVLGIRYRLGN